MEIATTIEIERPADTVFAYLADMANNPSWQNGQERCEWTSDPPIGEGSTYDQHARFLGKQIVSSFEVVDFVPGEVIRITSTGGTMPIDVTRRVRPLGESRSVVEAVVKGQPPLMMRLLGPVLRVLVARSVRADYRRLKALLESTEPNRSAGGAGERR